MWAIEARGGERKSGRNAKWMWRFKSQPTNWEEIANSNVAREQRKI
jgi:hypothetical protein